MRIVIFNYSRLVFFRNGKFINLLSSKCNNKHKVFENILNVDTSNVETSSTELINRQDEENLDSNMDTSSSNMDTSSSNMDTYDKKHAQKLEEEPKTRMKKEELEAIILEVCNVEYKTLEEIAAAIGKASKYLKNIIMPELIKSGKLERLYPKINHPHQAYKTTNK